jgi:NAD-dependent deacetylase
MTVEPRLREVLDEARAGDGRIVVLTGAGISAESGIPTFRGKEGYWKVGSRNYHPQELATSVAFSRLPHEVWRWYLYRRTVCRGAEPNPGHRALVELEEAMGDRFRLVTQNVDGLHMRAGSRAERLYEIHGNIDFMRCARRCTTAIYRITDAVGSKGRDDGLEQAELAALTCPDCDGPARPHVLWFDEYYDEPLFRAESALRAASEACLLIVVGTSGVTNLPIQIGMLSARRGIPILDINLDDNPFTQMAAHVDGFTLRGPAGEMLPAVVEVLGGA